MKKILLTLIIIILYVIIFKEFNIKIYNKLPIQVKTIILSLLSNDKTSKKIINDLKTKFLPETQLIDLNYKKIKLSGIDLEEFEVALGLYSDLNGDIMLTVENGPKGGDEINKLIFKNNYGWNIASYGEEYGVKKQRQPTLFKSHSERNFTEPLFSYTPSIAPSIIKLDNNFSPFWRDNFLMGTLIYGHLVRLKFDKNFDKLILNEPIYIGERIRDLIYIKNSKIILLALESTGSIGLLSLKN